MLANEHIMHYGDKFVQVKDNRNRRKYRQKNIPIVSYAYDLLCGFLEVMQLLIMFQFKCYNILPDLSNKTF